MEKVDVLILGGGLSGLSAAYQLHKKAPDLKVLVAEADSRVGGRTQSLDVSTQNGQKDTLDLGGHWVCERQKDIMDLIHELGGIEYYPQNIQGTKIMQVGRKNIVRTYKSEIPNMGTLKGLIDSQRLINHVESLVQQVDIRDPYACPLAETLDSKTFEELVKEITDIPEVFDVFNAAFLSK